MVEQHRSLGAIITFSRVEWMVAEETFKEGGVVQTVRFHTPMRVHLSDARIWGYGNGVASEKGNYFMHSR